MDYQTIDASLRCYIKNEIIPRYDYFDAAHQRDHAEKVIANSLSLAQSYPVDRNMVYAIAAFHDVGLIEGRQYHHLVSGRIIRNDPQLPRWFSSQQLELMAQAAEDHRASIGYRPRNIYGLIVAEADRDIEPMLIIRRTIQYGLDHYPTLEREGHWQRTLHHLHEKYAVGGYLQLFIPHSPNKAKLEQLQGIIADTTMLKSYFDQLYDECRKSSFNNF